MVNITAMRECLQVVKGCWQLSGGHKGDRASDRTGGSAAVEDFDKFFDAGVPRSCCPQCQVRCGIDTSLGSVIHT